MGLSVFVRLSEGNYVNVDQIQLTRKGKQNGNIIQLVGMPHPLTVSDDAEFSILCKALDALQATVPGYIDSAANVTSSPGPDTLNAEFRQWATDAGFDTSGLPNGAASYAINQIKLLLLGAGDGNVIIKLFDTGLHVGTCTRADCLTILRMLGWKQK